MISSSKAIAHVCAFILFLLAIRETMDFLSLLLKIISRMSSFIFGARTRRRRCRAFTMIELLIVVAIIGILVGIGIPLYSTQLYRAKVARAITDIYTIQRSITEYLTDRGELPDSLEEVEWDHLTDPWGNKYQYVKIDSEGEEGNGGKGKDKDKGKGKEKGGNGEMRTHETQALNSDYDLYSTGKDGKSEAPITAEESQDDVVRANNGSFINLASDYQL